VFLQGEAAFIHDGHEGARKRQGDKKKFMDRTSPPQVAASDDPRHFTVASFIASAIPSPCVIISPLDLPFFVTLRGLRG
jgi:hypothetical protein